MERLLYNDLCHWKARTDRKPLILNGARQVGKTWLLRHFGANEYQSVAYINCERQKEMEAIFADFDVVRIIRTFAAYTGMDILPGQTLIILDEIQEFPRALTALKYFMEDAPQYHIAVAGSLLGISLHKDVSFPVGKVQTLSLYPMSFEEFLLALGKEKAAEAIITRDYTTACSIPEMFVELLRQYYFVGGMPEVVQAYVSGAGPYAVRQIQKQILSDYNRDFSKHTHPREAIRIRSVWNSLPRQLAKENKKFIYRDVKKGSRASEYETAIQWLLDAGLIYQVPRVSEPRMPLRFYEEPTVNKLFILDVGLLGALMDAPADKILIGDQAFVEYKGAFTEQYVLTQLKPLGLPVYYYGTNDSKVEIDFVMQHKDHVVAVEVKAESNVRGKSLRFFHDKFPDVWCVRFSMLPYRQQEWLTNIPLYTLSATNGF